MFDYKIKLNGEQLEGSDEKTLVCFLKMLDFSAEYLHEIYKADKFRFSPEEKLIYIDEEKKHDNRIDEMSKSYGFQLKNQ